VAWQFDRRGVILIDRESFGGPSKSQAAHIASGRRLNSTSLALPQMGHSKVRFSSSELFIQAVQPHANNCTRRLQRIAQDGG
jgi:hypothetical protein